MKRMRLIILLPVGILLIYLSTINNGIVEKVYSEGFYKFISAPISTATGTISFSLGEITVILLVLFALWYIAHTIFKIVKVKTGRIRIAFNFLCTVLSVISVIFFAFVIIWGINYQRQPFSVITGLDTKPAPASELEDLCSDLIDKANTLRNKVDQDSRGVMYLSNGKLDAFNRAYKGYKAASNIYPVLGGNYGRPKSVSLLSWLMSYAGISGVYFPYTGEANVNIIMPDCMIPCTAAHEMAHQRGFAREDEANYISYLTCSLHPDADFQYSGTLLALIHSMSALYSADQARYKILSTKYSAGVLRDLKDNDAFWNKYEGPFEKMSSSINNAYLKANLQKEGIESYGRMVDLLIAERRKNLKK